MLRIPAIGSIELRKLESHIRLQSTKPAETERRLTAAAMWSWPNIDNVIAKEGTMSRVIPNRSEASAFVGCGSSDHWCPTPDQAKRR